MTIFDTFIQGVIQGLTEFLPVSSSGHLSLVQYFTGQGGEFGALFSILLHLGTLLAVFIAFYKTILMLIIEAFYILKDIFTLKFTFRTKDPHRKMIFMIILSLVPLPIFYVFLKDWYRMVSSDNSIITEGICFLITSFLLFTADRCTRGKKDASDMTSRDALVMGIAQSIAPLPGISRSGSTVAAGMIMGLEKEFAVTFSFIMGMPAVLGANILEIPELIGTKFNIDPIILLVGLVTSLVFGLLAIFMVKWLVRTNKYVYFAYYTFILGLVVTGIGIYEQFSGHAIQQLLIGKL
ncbi:MAG: undecaprenyl-diphosphate phosphatase [Oscillospiraceae bacterium]|nr:undecaprenyl-diphosphate phosphatase [Oscillospiraceae bacterium]